MRHLMRDDVVPLRNSLSLKPVRKTYLCLNYIEYVNTLIKTSIVNIMREIVTRLEH